METTTWDWDESQKRALEAARAGQSLSIQGGAGSGKTAVALEIMRAALAEAGNFAGSPRVDDSAVQEPWAPGLFITPDRRRSVRAEAGLAHTFQQRRLTGMSTSGSHRLVRSLSSYAYLVIGLWLVEREDPKDRVELFSGAEEDAWLQSFLEGLKGPLADQYGPQVRDTPAFRMELRNLMARSGQAGLFPSDLVELGETLGQPLWTLAGQAYDALAGGSRAFTVETPHLDAARAPLIAAGLLRGWREQADRQGVLAPIPAPRVTVLDDVQDMPRSARELVLALSEVGSQVIFTHSASEAVAGFRGGVADLGSDLEKALDCARAPLTTNHRSPRTVAAVVSGVEEWFKPTRPEATSDAVPVSKAGGEKGSVTAGRGTGGPASGGSTPEPPGDSPGVSLEVVATRSARDARIAGLLTQAHVYGDVDWSDMAVVLRHSGAVEALQQALVRHGVPVRSGERPVVLSKIPICTALLEVLSPSSLEERFAGDKNHQAQALLLSPLVEADSLGVLRALRSYRRASEGRAHAGLADLLEDLAAGEYEPSSGVQGSRRKLATAAAIWALKDEAALLPPQTGLWKIWDAAGISDSLRDRALGGGWRGRAASEDLDAVLALFRKADLWQQERSVLDPNATAAEFAELILMQTVATDPLVPAGLIESGVSIVTPTQVAGLEKQLVILAGLEEGSWPTATNAGFGGLDRLNRVLSEADASGWPGMAPIAPFLADRGAIAGSGGSFVTQAHRLDEARMFLVGLSRASLSLHLLAVENEDSAPSSFVLHLEQSGLVKRRAGGAVEKAERLLSLPSAALRMRRLLLDDDSSPEQKADAAKGLALLRARGIRQADPATWSLTGSVSTDSPILSLGPLRLSPSGLDATESCGLRWFLDSARGSQQDLGYEQEDLKAAQLGTLVHEIAEEYPRGTAEQLTQALIVKWEQLGLGQEILWQRRAFDDLVVKLQRLGRYFQTVDGQVLTEQRVSFEVEGAVISGRADRIEIGSDGSARVTDIKTGSVPAQKDMASNRQLTAYQVGVTELGYRTSGAALLGLKLSRNILRSQEALSPEQIVEEKSSLAELAGRLSGSHLQATPSIDCMSCQFRAVCPAKDESIRSHE